MHKGVISLDILSLLLLPVKELDVALVLQLLPVVPKTLQDAGVSRLDVRAELGHVFLASLEEFRIQMNILGLFNKNV